MKVSRITVNACCGRKNILFKLDRPIDLNLLEILKSKGFTEAPHFTKAGMLYVDNLALIVSGPIGMDRLSVKCKKEDCDQILNDFEELLIKTG